MKATDQSQSVEKFQSVSINNSSTQIKFREQLWTAALEERAMKGLQLIKICEQLWTVASEGRAMKGLQLIASNYGLQH